MRRPALTHALAALRDQRRGLDETIRRLQELLDAGASVTELIPRDQLLAILAAAAPPAARRRLSIPPEAA